MFIFISEGIKQECYGEFDQNLEEIENSINCICVFRPSLGYLLLIGILSGCYICNLGSHNGD